MVELIRQSKKRKLLPYITTDVNFINFDIFDGDNFIERLKLTKEHLKRAMNKQHKSKRFAIISLFRLGTSMETTQEHIKMLEKWKSERLKFNSLTSYEKFKYFISKR